ncbi:MAG: glycosyltransferase family 4 protein [Cyanobium sp.]
MVNFYADFTNLCSETLASGNDIDRSALQRSCLAVYAYKWAAQSAIHHYNAPASKVKVVEFGANVDNPPCLDDILCALQRRALDNCQLLFVGVDWFRKGGPKALAVADLLNKRGLYTELHVVGCVPPKPWPSFLRSHGFISKGTESGRKRLHQLFLSSHFFFMPTLAECYGLVFAEASAYGVPSLASDVGGVCSAINNGLNGWTLPVDATAEQYCQIVEALMASPKSYRSVALSCFKEYNARLNWQSAASSVVALLDMFCRSTNSRNT